MVREAKARFLSLLASNDERGPPFGANFDPMEKGQP